MRLLFSGLFMLSSLWCKAQLNSSTAINNDSIAFHSPKKAFIMSACLPGAGQVYNHIAMPKGKKKAFWKLPLIYGSLGTTGYFLIKNQQIQRSLKTEYDHRIHGGELANKWADYDNQGVLTLYNHYSTKRDLSILGFCAIYLLQIVDAGVEAHFVHFDVSDNLSLAIEPSYFGSQTVGFKLDLNFH
jgi:hypothetical protein